MRSVNESGRGAARQHRRVLLAALAATALSLVQARTAIADATISIDAKSTHAQEDGYALRTLKDIFQSGNAPGSVSGGADAADPMLPLLAGIGTKRARLLLIDEYCDIDAQGTFGGHNLITGNFDTPDCAQMMWQIDWLLKANLSPHMAVASHMPTNFIPFGEPETWGDRRIDPLNPNSPKIIDHYKDYAKKLVRYIATRAFSGGAQTAVFEVSNEIDIAADYPNCSGSPATCAPPDLGPWKRWLWWIDPTKYVIDGYSQAYAITDEDNPQLGFPYNGDVRRLGRNLLPVQKIFADAITEVNIELSQNSLYSGKTIEIAGPAMAGWNLIVRPQGTAPSLEEQFIEQVFNPNALPYGAKFNMPLDRFSFHYYGSAETLLTHTVQQACDDVTQPFALFELMTNAYKTKLAAFNMQNVPLFLSEWGPSSCTNGDVNYSHKGAAWVAAFLPEALAQGVTMGSFLTVEDRLVYGGASALSTASLMHTYGNAPPFAFLPKPHTNVFEMYTLMSGLRNQITLTPGGSSSHLNAFVTSDQNSTNVMVYNFDPYLVFNNDANTRTGTAETFTISVSNIFKTVGYSGQVKVERYLVDKDHSNLAYYLQHKDDTPPPVSGPGLYKLTGTTATASNGTLQLTSESPLGLGVILYRITPN